MALSLLLLKLGTPQTGLQTCKQGQNNLRMCISSAGVISLYLFPHFLL